jgi:hypothetical protein
MKYLCITLTLAVTIVGGVASGPKPAFPKFGTNPDRGIVDRFKRKARLPELLVPINVFGSTLGLA